MDDVLLSIESSDPDLAPAARGLASALGSRATVFVPLPAVRPEARMAATVPAMVVVALGPSETTAVGDWLSSYLDRYPNATVTCAVGARSIRLDAAQRSSARDGIAGLLGA